MHQINKLIFIRILIRKWSKVFLLTFSYKNSKKRHSEAKILNTIRVWKHSQGIKKFAIYIGKVPSFKYVEFSSIDQKFIITNISANIKYKVRAYERRMKKINISFRTIEFNSACMHERVRKKWEEETRKP